MNNNRSVVFVLFCLFFSTIDCVYEQDMRSSVLELKTCCTEYKADFEWAIVGAGPAGIVSVGVLCDLGVPAETIAWIDPVFNVGRLGQFYMNVPGNAKNKMYVDFLKVCKTFQEVHSPALDTLYNANPEECGVLSIVVQPLQDITDYLRTKICSFVGIMDFLSFENGVWIIGSEGKVISSRHVILATGSHPKALDYPIDTVIPLDYALDKATLNTLITPEDSVAVVGSAHSAILVMKHLTELQVKKIVNFFNRPITYAVDMGTWTLNNTYGLKGTAAQWAREVLEGNPPAYLFRYINNEENRALHLSECNKIVYAIGYEKNSLPLASDAPELNFDPDTGIVGPRIFGIGIAFPGSYIDPAGEKHQLIGLSSFMKYDKKVIPSWVDNSRDVLLVSNQLRALSLFEELFVIQLL